MSHIFSSRARNLSYLFLAPMLLMGCKQDGGEQETVKIGRLLPFTGAFAQNTVNIELGTELALQDINANGGVLDGAKLAFETRDTEGVPEVGAAAAQELLDMGIEVIEGELASFMTQAILDVTEPAGALLMTGVSQSSSLTATEHSGLFFRTSQRSYDTAAEVAIRMKANGEHRVAIIKLNGGLTETFAAEFSAAFTAQDCGASPCEVVHTVAYDWPEGTDVESFDFQTRIDEIMAITPEVDAIVFACFPTDGIAYIQAAVDAVDPAGNLSSYDGTILENIYTLSSIPGGEPQVNFRKEVWKRFTWSDAGWGTDQSVDYWEKRWAESGAVGASIPTAASSFDATILYALAITQAGSTDPAAVAEALRDVANPPGTVVQADEYAKAIELIRNGEDIDYQGPSGPIDFNDFGDVAPNAEMYKMKEGGELYIDG